jgi:hypothetical protein
MAKLHEVEIHRLRPTQITVGMIEVHDKRAQLEALKKHEQRDFMQAHPIPGVWGPDGKLYITDHHHLGRAASEADVDTGFFWVEDDFTHVPIAQFWPKMDAARWVHPIDQHGKLCPFEAIPDHLQKLIDDPYRSLAGYVRNAGGYDKTPTAFAEFLWADFFRPRVVIGPTRADFDNAVQKALPLATSGAAANLPGYKGAVKPAASDKSAADKSAVSKSGAPAEGAADKSPPDKGTVGNSAPAKTTADSTAAEKTAANKSVPDNTPPKGAKPPPATK